MFNMVMISPAIVWLSPLFSYHTIPHGHQTARLLQLIGKSRAQIARELGISDIALYSWCRHILPALGGIQLAKLTVQHVQKFDAQVLQKGLSPQSVRLHHAMLHKAFDYAVRVDLLPRNVCDNVSLPRIEKHETRAFSLEQALRLIETAQGHRMEALFVLALVTGMWRGEIIGLKWSDVNLTDGVISVQRSLVELKGGIIESKPKSSRGYRSILLPPFALGP
jgi:integrase